MTIDFVSGYLSLLPDLNFDLSTFPTVPAINLVLWDFTTVHLPVSDLVRGTFLPLVLSRLNLRVATGCSSPLSGDLVNTS